MKNIFDISVYTNCYKRSFFPIAKVRAIHSIKLENYSVRVEKIPMSAISDKAYQSEESVKVLP